MANLSTEYRDTLSPYLLDRPDDIDQQGSGSIVCPLHAGTAVLENIDGEWHWSCSTCTNYEYRPISKLLSKVRSQGSDVELPVYVARIHLTEYLWGSRLYEDSDAASTIESLPTSELSKVRIPLDEVDNLIAENLNNSQERPKYAANLRRFKERMLEETSTSGPSHSLTDFLAADDDPLEYVIEDCHIRGGNTLIAAQGKAGKTTLVLNLIRSLADGVPFLDNFKVQSPAGRIGLINLELLRQQLRVWLADIGIENTDKVVVWQARGRTLDLDTEAGRKEVEDWLRKNGIEVLIIDPLFGAYGGNENSNTAIGEWLDGLDRVKLSVNLSDLFMTDHTGWNNDERVRGGSRKRDWADSLWTYTAQDDRRWFKAEGRDVAVDEGEVMYNPHNRRLAYAPGSGAREDRTISEAMVTKVVQAVSDNPECTVKDIKAVLREMGLKNDGQQQEAIREARQLRLIHHQIPDVPIEDNPGKGKPQRNIVTNEGREWLEMRKT